MTVVESPPRYLLDRVVHVDPHAASSNSSLTSGKGVPVVTMKVGFAAEWLTDALMRLQDLAALAPDWDSYGAKPVEADMAMAAVRFLATLAAAAPGVDKPSVVPLSDGGVQVEWHRGGIDLEVAFSDDEPGVYLVDHTSNATVQHPLGDALGEVLRVATKLSAA
jgi:hypothetical protein